MGTVISHQDYLEYRNNDFQDTPLQYEEHDETSPDIIPKLFFESCLKMHEYDMIQSCSYYKKSGLKPIHNVPFHEVCFGISEISSFLECFTRNASRMKYLRKISMNWNILSYQDLEHDSAKLHGKAQRLGSELRSLKNLEHIEFKIFRNQPKSLLSLFKNAVTNKSIKALTFEIQASKLQREDLKRISELLEATTNLQYLNLSFKRCLLAEDSFRTLFKSFKKLRGIKKLSLNFAFISTLTENCIQQIVDLLEILPGLTSLYVNMSGTDLEDRHIRTMMEKYSKSPIIKQCYVKVGSCRKVTFRMESQAKGLEGFFVAK